MYTTDMYEGLFAETVTVTGANGDQINAYQQAAVQRARVRSRRWYWHITCLVGMSGIAKLHSNSPITDL